MARPILTHPDARLRDSAEPIRRFDDTLQLLLADLGEALGEGPGAVGVAAPQLGEKSRVVIVDCRNSLRPCRNHGLLQMINPEILAHEGESLGREGCLSVPDWVGMVPRAREVHVAFHDTQGVRHEIEAGGFEARVIQHEIDHLDGILFIDRVISTRDLVRRK
ncbi:MAG TPA: peptide deformylase [Mariprofundaceae bacterium]|nr:peptide deformylase [Mariprofundaceae bacterium]